jgi:hypothetical protein
MADAILAAFVLGPLLLTFLLKSNAALSFLALCAGFVVISFAGSDLQNLTGQLNFSIDSSLVNLFLLILPFVLAGSAWFNCFMRGRAFGANWHTAFE